MQRPFARLVLVITTAFLAGCLTDPFVPTTEDATPEYEAESEAPDGRANEPARTPANEPAPAPAPIRERSDPEHAMEGPGPSAMTSIDVGFQGRTAGRVCRGHTSDPSSACLILRPADNATVPLERLAKPVLLQGILTWNASTPSNDHLVVQLMVHNGNEYVYSDGPWGGRQYGESPLPVSFDLSRYAGQHLALAIGPDECILETGPAFNCAFAGSAMVHVPQAFAFKGELSGWD